MRLQQLLGSRRQISECAAISIGEDSKSINFSVALLIVHRHPSLFKELNCMFVERHVEAEVFFYYLR
jgi:hypothetical protein